MDKILVQIFIPLSDNEGKRFPGEWYQQLSRQLNERYGGVTIYQHAPVTGLWKQEEAHTQKDELVIYEVIADDMEFSFWKPLKKQLEEQFRQESILVRSMPVHIL